MDKKINWQHPGGKLRELGADSLSNSELLSIIISSGIKGKSAENISNEIMNKFGSFKGLANQPMDKLFKIKGLSKVKITRIAAVLEIARRIVKEVIENNE